MYETLSEFARSWALLGMTVFFVLVVIWVFLPRNRAAQDDAARSIFRNETRPGAEGPSRGDGQGA